jgi:hypothetical protein
MKLQNKREQLSEQVYMSSKQQMWCQNKSEQGSEPVIIIDRTKQIKSQNK